MRPRVLMVIFLLTGAPPPVMAERAGSLSGSLWVGASGLQTKLTEDGNSFTLRAEHGMFGNFFSGISTGTTLLRAYRSGDDFSGTAFVFSPSCTLSYQVRGRSQDREITWWGEEPRDVEHGTCRVTKTALVTTSVRLKWAPTPPTPPARILPKPVAQPSHSQATPPPTIGVGTVLVIASAIVIISALGALSLRLAYLHRLRSNKLTVRPLPAAPREPASAFSSSLPSSSGKILGNRTQIIEADAEFVSQHTHWLLQRTAQTNAAADLVQARLRFVTMLSELATVPALMNHSDPNASPRSFLLSLAEIEQMIAAMPEINTEVRAALLKLLAARLKEKLQ